MAKVYAGTSGWAYPAWKPDFYPPKLAAAKFLGYYATRLNTVEINYTFRRMVTPKVIEGWVAATPETFRFAIKANQVITHVKRLRDAEEFTRRFLDSIQPLAQAGRLGPVLFQLPPFLKKDAALLDAFLAELPHSAALKLAFEFRHGSWFGDAVYDVLRKYGAALCVAGSEKIECPDVTTGAFAYYRFRKPEYSAGELKQIEAKMREHTQAGHDVFAYFKHEDTPAGARYAEELLK
ncbi:MAG TPA: DUF72 domain-containing protein [Terriglobales bacterium]|nr:DUF72 domain-containing protein [Terriglobales bacterium]